MVFTSDKTGGTIPATDLLSWLFDESVDEPDRPLLIDAQNPDTHLSWNEIKGLVQELAAGFNAQGLRSGDCLCILSESNVYYYPTVYACIAAGATFYGAPTRWTAAECAEYCVPFAGATHFLVDPEFVGHATAALGPASDDPSRIWVHTGPGTSSTYSYNERSLQTWSSLLGHGNTHWEAFDDIHFAQTSTPIRLNTGATTGAPKVAELSHYAAIAHIFQWCHAFKTTAFEFRAVHYLHLSGIDGYAFITTAVKLGFPVYLTRNSIDDIHKAYDAVKPSLAMIDPYTMVRLVKMLPPGSSALDSLRDVRLPSMKFPPNALELAQKALHPDCLISRPYGLTEMGSVSATLYSQRHLNDPLGVGFTFPGSAVKMIDHDGNEITTCDTPGEILVQTRARFQGYYKDSVKTAAAFRDDWFVTGDIGYISSTTQQWYIIGRKQLLFRVQGEYVALEDVESVLASHEHIVSAAVAPIRSEDQADPRIKALVMLKSPGILTEGDVLEFASQHLYGEKTITGGVTFVDNIPRNGMGKVIRWKLDEIISKLPG